MDNWWDFILQDAALIFGGLDSRDLIYPMACVLMLFIFFMPLRNIDRRDSLCGLMYVVYLIASGTIMFFAVPGVEKGLTAIGLHLAFVSILGALAFYRWFHQNDQLVIVQQSLETKTESAELQIEK